MSTGFFARAIFVCAIALAATNLACDKSPSAPTLPAPLTVTAQAAPTVTALTVTGVSPTRGPASFADEVRVTGTGFLPGATLTLDGVAATANLFRSNTLISGRTPVHAPGTVDVVVTNPDGQSARLTGGYTFDVITASLTASPSLVAPGSQLTLNWVGPSGRACFGGGDWIAIYKVGDPDVTGAANGHSDLWFDHVCGATSGTFRMSAPTQLGQYEFRFLIGDKSVARSNTVSVTASASPLIPAWGARER